MSIPIPKLPHSSISFTLSGGGYQITLPNYFDTDDEAQDGRTYSAELPGVDGTYRTRDATFGAKRITLSGFLVDSYTVDVVRKIVGSKRITVFRDGHFLTGDVTDHSIKLQKRNTLWSCFIEVTSQDAYWTGDTLTSAVNPSTVTNNGDVATYPVLTITGGSGGASVAGVTIDGRTAEYTGALGLDEVLIIDCRDLTARIDGTGVLGGMNASFFTNPPRLYPGPNQIGISVTGAANVEITRTELFLS